MLVLSRTNNERIVILVPPSTEPRQIEVAVCDVVNGKVRMGVEADRDVAVWRDEVLARMKEQRDE